MNDLNAQAQASPTVIAGRAALRERYLDQNKTKSKRITFLGMEVEVRQQDLTQIMTMGMVTDDEALAYDTNRLALQTAKSIVASVFTTDTGERVFDDSDLGQIVKWPWSSDLERLQTAIAELSDPDKATQAAEEQIAKNPL